MRHLKRKNVTIILILKVFILIYWTVKALSWIKFINLMHMGIYYLVIFALCS